LALTSPTSGGLSIGIARLPIKATEFVLFLRIIFALSFSIIREGDAVLLPT
jgi:hypothetical protein